jgi:purine/pyrimidine-nucleoside phosphorylase
MLKHNTYFEGKVQSIGFSRLGRAQSVGVVEPGEHRFGTQAPERMTVVSGEFLVKRLGEDHFTLYAAGTFFEVAGNSAFEVLVSEPCAYLCEYL